MNTNATLSPENPLIAAYAFGELEGDELVRIEAAVQNDPALQAAVTELRAFAGQLADALAEEPEMIAKEEAPDVSAATSVAPTAPRPRRARLIPFPLYYLATAAAAGFAVVVWMQNEGPTPHVGPITAQRAVIAPQVTVKMASGRKIATDESQAVAASPSIGIALKPASSTPVDFASTLATGASDGSIKLPPQMEAGAMSSVSPVPVSPQSESVGSINARGRAQYLAGDLAHAEGTFSDALVVDPHNATANAFVSRIAKEKNQLAELNRLKTKAQMLEEVATAWQRPGAYVDSPTVAKMPVTTSSGEAYAYQPDDGYHAVADDPLSTFSIDVDTASYANVRRFIMGGALPPRDAVRIEELVNYFPYDYAPPSSDAPFAAHLAVASAPWAPAHRLVRIALKGREFPVGERPAANLVFLLDVSGSMSSANKLPLVKESLRLLLGRLQPDDHVAIVTYASGTGLALPSTPASRPGEILAALDNLRASGSTNGGMGIQLAYDVAKANFVPGGVNRVILCTDGDFNVGITSRGGLLSLIQEKAKSRVFLSVFGFGMGNYKDSTLELLADKGNGAYGYIDTRREAEKVFVEQAEGTLATIAKDVKIQVEFNPARVQSYRLIGYENRLLNKEDFNNDAVDAGEIGAGHTVTALYEVVPVGIDGDGAPRPAVDPLKYQPSPEKKRATANSPELLTVKVRYKAPEGDVSRRLEFPLVDAGADFAKADGDFQFAAAVAAWGMLLRDSGHKGTATYGQVLDWAENGLGGDTGGHRAEFIRLVRRSQALSER